MDEKSSKKGWLGLGIPSKFSDLIALRSIESRAQEQGRSVIDEEFIELIAALMGRGSFQE